MGGELLQRHLFTANTNDAGRLISGLVVNLSSSMAINLINMLDVNTNTGHYKLHCCSAQMFSDNLKEAPNVLSGTCETGQEH